MMRHSTPTLFESARHVIVPEGIVSTGWPAVRDTCRELGITFDPWQQGSAQLILSKGADGLYATTVGGVTISIPRQVGKTFMIGWIVFALCIIYPGLTVVWTAHRASTADETFDGMKSMAATPTMAPHIDRTPDNGSEQKIEFKNGSRVVFGARERGFGRGFTKLDVVVFDEAQILTERSIDDMIPAQNASDNALTIMIGTPPKPIDPSEIFQDARRAALNGEAPDALYIEFSADPKADPDDRAQWRKANPSYPQRTKEAAMLRMRRKLSPDSFMREALGIWDEISLGKLAFTAKKWDDLAIENPDPEWPVAAYGVDMNPERTKVSIGVATFSDDGGVHLEVAADAPFDEAGTSALVDWLWTRAKRHVPVVIDAYSPARPILEAALKNKKMLVRILDANEYSQACVMLREAVEKHPAITHFGQEHLDHSAKNTVQDQIKNRPGSFKWNRPSLDVDLSPIVSITCAHFGAVKFAKRRLPASERKQRHAIVG
ncbi:terminase [Arthrobacter sp. MA-N2]|uniref:terminase n=1 Tax=Arthrobacter sp. MA-N2 TaxID=1101188 RepID=UPI0004B175BF|nr:terminase [Arthrobacter sp. MA-N2]